MKGQKNKIPSSALPAGHDLAVLGHELGNVLNGILGMTELLGDSALTAEQQRWLRAIRNSGRQMQSLIQSARCHEHGNKQAIVPQPVRTDGVDLLEQLLISHVPAAQSRKNRLILVPHPDLEKYWYLDACLFRQVLDNLLGNAIKFTSGGDVIVEASSIEAEGVQEKALSVKVSDTGLGFDSSAVNTIFGAYCQLGPSHLDGAGGRGLGLFICTSILQALDGRISCSSPESGGACFEIVVPGTLHHPKNPVPDLRSELLSGIRCQLQLTNPVRRSVESFLTRLGMRFSDLPRRPQDRGQVLVISDAPGRRINGPPGLLLTPVSGQGVVPGARVLEAPVLESSLGRLLLELALEWRSLVLRNEIQGSIPTQR